MMTREIQGHLKELYQVEVSPTLIASVTDALLEDVRAWESRPLEVTKTWGAFPTHISVRKVVDLAMMEASEHRTSPARD